MKRVFVLLVSGLVLILPLQSPGLSQVENREATILSLQGTVEVKSGKKPWQKAQKNMVLVQGDIIRTKNKSSATLNVDGTGKKAAVEMKENSQLRLAELKINKADSSETTLLDLALGAVLIKAEKLHSEKSRFEVKTPTSIVGVRGTTFSVAVEAEE